MDHFDTVFSSIERPFAWLDFDALDQNIDFVNKASGQKQIRIATKSIRSVEVLKYIKQHLERCSGFMTFTARETLYLLEKGFNHLLIGYPVYEEQAISEIASFVKAGKDITFMIDHIEQAFLLQKIAEISGIHFQICIDLNMSSDYHVLYFGTKRSPISTIEKLQSFLEQLRPLTNLRIHAAMGYDAQIAGVADVSAEFFGLKGKLIRLLKRHSKKGVTRFRQDGVKVISKNHQLAFVNAGGSGSMKYCCTQDDVTEITVGSAFFAPALFDGYDDLKLAPAAGFALRITREFSDHIFVCHGGGYIASGAIGKDRLPAFLEPQYYSFTPLEGAGEVQTPIVVKNRSQRIGDTIYFRHAKAGELCERFNELHTTRSGTYTGSIRTYRGDGQCFL